MPAARLTEEHRRWEACAIGGSAAAIAAALAEAEARGAAEWVATLSHAASFLRGGAPCAPVLDRDETADVGTALAVRAAVLSLDLREAEQLAAAIDRSEGNPALVEGSRAWLALAKGDDARAVLERAERLQRLARQEGRGVLVVDAAALSAMALLALEDFDAAVARARAASRMAGAEGIGPLPAIAHLTLARARRLAGHPHLGAHVAAVLARHLGPAALGWARWEQMLGAGATVHEPDPPTGHDAATTLSALLAALAAGDRERYGDRAAELEVAPLPRFAHEDVALLCELADHRGPLARSAAWIAGATDAVPQGLDGCHVVRGAYVLATPNAPPRRILAIGAALAQRELGAEIVAPAEAHLRTDSAIALLLSVGPAGIEAGELFQRLYGFALVDRHRGVLRVLLHRVRQRAPGLAMTRDGDRLALTVDRALAFLDPRCARPDGDLLALAARQGAVAPKDLLELGVPLRRAQESLRRLADAGIVRVEPQGRGVAYVLEDTTFTSPTITPS